MLSLPEDEKLRAKIAPRRRIPGTFRPLDEAHAKKALAKAKKMYRASLFERGLNIEDDLQSRRKAAHALLTKPSIEAVKECEADVFPVAMRMLDFQKYKEPYAEIESAIALTHGVETALRARTDALGLAFDHSGGFNTCVFVTTEKQSDRWHTARAWLPVRDVLAACTKKDYERALEIVDELREGYDPFKQSFVAYAFPDERWATEDLRAALDDPSRSIAPVVDLLSATNDVEIAREVVRRHREMAAHAIDLAYALPEADAIEILSEALAQLLTKPKWGPLHKTPPREVATVLALFRDERAANVLAPYFGHAILGPIVAEYFKSAPELGEILAVHTKGKKSEGTALRLIASKKEDDAPITTAVPRVLRDRPWLPPKKKKPRDVKKLRLVDDPPILDLTEEERAIDYEKALGSPVRDMTKSELASWRAAIAKDEYATCDWQTSYLKSGRGVEYVRVPEDEGLAAWNAGKAHPSGPHLALLVRFGEKAIDGFFAFDWIRWLRGVYEGEDDCMRAAMRVIAPRMAPLFAAVMARRKRYRNVARDWLLAHARVAALGLIPNALGEEGEARDEAEDALLLLARKGHENDVREAAKRYGVDIDDLLARDPLAIDRKPPKMPSFLRTDDLPSVRMKDGSRIADVTPLVEMLSIAPLDPPYAGVEQLKEACDEKSLGEFAREVLEQWILGGANGRHEWMLFAAAHFPSDDSARRLASLAREWSRKDQTKAARVCVALAVIGTDFTLMHLSHVADTTRFDELRETASSLLSEAASTRGLSREALEDRTVPDLGLGPDGTIELSYGKRTFTITLDEHLRPIVKGEKSLPRATKSDDAAMAKAARQRWDELKKDAEQISDRQIKRLERAMVEGRRWKREEFLDRIAGHPLLGHLGRRLVWKSGATFRINQDGTFSDANDREVDIADVTLPHPLEISDRDAWTTIFADYEILQPFDQLGRVIHVGDEIEVDLEVPSAKILGTLESRGWRRNDRGYVTSYTRTIRGVRGTLPLDPGISMENVDGTQKLERVELEGTDAVAFSELVRDVESLR